MNVQSAKQPYPASAADSNVAHLVQITDCHIFAAAEERLYGLDTRQSFTEVIQAAIGNHHKPDLLLATGDLAQDGKAASYEYLANEIDDLGIPTFWLPGNHDDNDLLEAHFTGNEIHSSKHLLIGNWQILLLDSTVRNQVYGQVSTAQLEFLNKGLKTFPDHHALVCLHHQAQDSGCEWLDMKGLKNSAQLRDQLALHDNVRAVLWGHVHQEFTQLLDNVLWMSTPSSCAQFKPASKEFALGSEAPGYRTLSLYANGHIETSVHRVEQDKIT